MRYALILAAVFTVLGSAALAAEAPVAITEKEVLAALDRWRSWGLIYAHAAIREAYPAEDAEVAESDIVIARQFKVPFVYGAVETRYDSTVEKDALLVWAELPFRRNEPTYGHFTKPGVGSVDFIRCEDNRVLLGDQLKIELHIDHYNRRNRVRSVWVTLYKNGRQVKSQLIGRDFFGCSPMP